MAAAPIYTRVVPGGRGETRWRRCGVVAEGRAFRCTLFSLATLKPGRGEGEEVCDWPR